MRNLIISFFILQSFVASAQVANNDHEVYANTDQVHHNIKFVENSNCFNVKEQNQKQSIKVKITNGFSQGNAKILSTVFPSNLSVSILGKSNLYSKPQAEQVLSTFFAQHKVVKFVIEHQGNSNDTKYFIGSYVSGKSTYRVTINVKVQKGVDQIKSISISSI